MVKFSHKKATGLNADIERHTKEIKNLEELTLQKIKEVNDEA